MGSGWVYNHPLYPRYNSMKQRCMNPNHKYYKHYGGRGIKVCERWLGNGGFKNYLQDIGEPPSLYHTVDRIDNDGNYEPTNIRWVRQRTQILNQRPKRVGRSGYRGVYWYEYREKWKAMITSEGMAIQLGLYDTPEDAAEAYNEAAIKYHGEYAKLNVVQKVGL